MVLKLGLNGSLVPGGDDVSSVAIPFGQGFERTSIFSLDRIEMRFSAVSTRERHPSGRLEMLSLVGDGGSYWPCRVPRDQE